MQIFQSHTNQKRQFSHWDCNNAKEEASMKRNHSRPNRWVTIPRIMSLVVVWLMITVSNASALLFADFEEPTYTNGTSFLGVDGWGSFWAGPGKITPDGGDTGVNTVLEGSQSAVLIGQAVYRTWGSAGTGIQNLISNNFALSFLIRQESLGTANIALGYNAPNGSTIAYLGFESGTIWAHSQAQINTGYTYDLNKTLFARMEFDFAATNYTVIVQNVTDAGPLTTLGTYELVNSVYDFRLGQLQDPTKGGLVISSHQDFGSPVTIIDDIQIESVVAVPEPTTVSLVALGGLAAMAWRRRTR